MHEDFVTYSKRSFHNTITAISNLFMFFPYFFSVEKLLKTLFAPWKNVVSEKKKPGLSLEDIGRVFADNFISRFMGFTIRAALLFSYILIQIVFLLSVPGIFIFQAITLPLRYLFYTSQPTPDQKKEMERKKFFQRHLAEQDNKAYVEQWFEIYYRDVATEPWWSMKKLTSQPPIGRDLTSGYTPTLDKYSNDLSTKKPHYKHLIGRKDELDRVQQVLSKTGESNVILVGDEGVGRRSIVEALAKSVYEGSSNPSLVYKRVIELEMEKVLASSDDFVKREETLGKLLNEAAKAKNIILFIDNIDQYIAQEEERINLSNIIEKYANLPTLQFIGITTPYLYQKYVYQNKQIAGLFDKVDITEVTANEALTILLDVSIELEKTHGVAITYEAIKQTIIKTDKFITDQPFPEKAIELLDEACVYVKSHQNASAVNAQAVSTLLEQKTHVPTEMSDSIRQKLLTLEAELKKKIYHQTEAVHKLSAALKKSFVMAGSRKKPLASFLFLGPTGVGKTATAKAVTEIFFDNINNMMRFDMSLYQSKTDIYKLIGSQETGEPGLMTQAIRKQRYGTLLLDELEKADKDLLNIFLTILDEGYYTDGFGKRVDCRNLIVIATSNAGADYIYQFMKESPDHLGDLSTRLVDHLVEQKMYSPEFLNRFDGVLVYKPLTTDAIVAIARNKLLDLKQQIQVEHGVNLTFSEDFIQQLIQKGYDPRFGARNMERIIRDEVEDKIAQTILEGKTSPGQVITF